MVTRTPVIKKMKHPIQSKADISHCNSASHRDILESSLALNVKSHVYSYSDNTPALIACDTITYSSRNTDHAEAHARKGLVVEAANHARMLHEPLRMHCCVTTNVAFVTQLYP